MREPKPSLKQEVGLSVEEKEDLDSVYIENLLDKLFSSHRVDRVNEGYHGVILKLDLRVFSEEERRDFCDHFNITWSGDNNMAIKMIKIYKAEQVKKEVSAQRKAAKLINGNPELNDAIGIPECYQGQEVSLTKQSLKRALKKNDIDVSSGKFSLIMMDYIEGEDLGMFVYKEFIKANFEKYKELYEVKSEITGADAELYLKDKSLNDLINICNYILGDKAKFHHLDDSFEARKERNDRAKKIIGKIEHRGLFSKESVVALRKALAILHNNGIYHGDLHFRNLIVEAETRKLFMIDFGSALMVKGLDQTNHIAGDEGVSDEAMVIYLDRLSKTPDDFIKDRIELDLGRAKRIQEVAIACQSKDKKKMTAKEIKIVGAWEKLKKQATEVGSFDKAVKNFGYDLGGFGDGEELFNAQIAGLLLLTEAGHEIQVKKYCIETINQPRVSQAFKNKLNLLLEYLA